MQLSALKKARQQEAGLSVEIISHSCLGKFLASVRLSDGGRVLLRDRRGQPKVWLALDRVKRDLGRQGITDSELNLCVAQDEVIRQPGMPAQVWDA
ncbi:MAG: hypothetical protein M1440_11970 [Gammaproteobacteria bacterium]|nr:hypothetical protein [Gammaproteobacteria bacterium]